MNLLLNIIAIYKANESALLPVSLIIVIGMFYVIISFMSKALLKRFP